MFPSLFLLQGIYIARPLLYVVQVLLLPHPSHTSLPNRLCLLSFVEPICLPFNIYCADFDLAHFSRSRGQTSNNLNWSDLSPLQSSRRTCLFADCLSCSSILILQQCHNMAQICYCSTCQCIFASTLRDRCTLLISTPLPRSD
jgi:hypothetical protein